MGIDYITISTGPTCIDFGDLITSISEFAATSNGTNERGIFAGGYEDNNVINYITISTPSNTTDFGDLTEEKIGLAACSNA